MQKIKQVKSNSVISFDSSNITINSLSSDALGEFIPNGGIISIDLNISGVQIPASGEVLNGYMLCDGSAIPNGYTMSGFVPNLNSDVFLMGSTQSGVGNINSNNRQLTLDQLPVHSHTVSFSTNNAGGFSVNSGNESSNHNHNVNNLPNHRHGLGALDGFGIGNSRNYTGGTQPIFAKDGRNSRDARFNSSALAPNVFANSASDNHVHGVNNVGNHAHNLNTTLSNAGSSDAIEFSPVYYNVVFLIAVR